MTTTTLIIAEGQLEQIVGGCSLSMVKLYWYRSVLWQQKLSICKDLGMVNALFRGRISFVCITTLPYTSVAIKRIYFCSVGKKWNDRKLLLKKQSKSKLQSMCDLVFSKCLLHLVDYRD